MNKKLNILFLQTDFPYPPTGGGRARSYYLLKELAKTNNITVLSFANSSVSADDVHVMKQLCADVVTVPFDGKHSVVRLLQSMFSSTPYKVLQYLSSGFHNAVRSVWARSQFDLVFSEHPYLAQYIPETASCVIAQNIELMSNIYRRTAESGNTVMRLYAQTQWKKMQAYETALIKNVGVFIALNSEEEKSVASLLPGIKTAYIPNGVDTGYFSPGQEETEAGTSAPSIIFTGVFSYYPNEQAALHFVQNILPGIRKRYPGIHLFLVGKDPGSAVKNLAGDPGITVTGFVDDVRPYVRRAAVVVVPLLIGGGTRLKILEAMAMGKPVVSTRVGCEGLDVTDGENIVIADTPEEFGGAVTALLDHPQRRRALGDHARMLVERTYRWDAIGKKLDGFIHEVVASKNGAGERA